MTNSQILSCLLFNYSVDGKWGRWTKWSACSKTCGGYGKRTRARQCDSPPPAHGGRDCIGSNISMVYCNTYTPCQGEYAFDKNKPKIPITNYRTCTIQERIKDKIVNYMTENIYVLHFYWSRAVQFITD